MPKLGFPEILLILLVVIIVFGVGKLPDVGRQLGKGIRDFKKYSAGTEDEAAAASGTVQATTTSSSELEIAKAKLEAAEAKLKLAALQDPSRETTS